MKQLIDEMEEWEIANKYDRDKEISKFLKKHGEDYTQEELIKFLRERYQYINKINGPDHS